MLIAGLGNPGSAYEHTRHNSGFMLVDLLSEEYGIRLVKSGHALWGRGIIGGKEVILLKPQTFMNLSGTAIAAFKESFSVEKDSLLLVYDDCDLPLGRIRLRKNGGSGGHRGLHSVIEHLKSAEFPRLRLGIGRPGHGSIVDYVLTPFAPEEERPLAEMLEKGAECVKAFVTNGLNFAMNEYNSSN